MFAYSRHQLEIVNQSNNKIRNIWKNSIDLSRKLRKMVEKTRDFDQFFIGFPILFLMFSLF